MKQAANPIGMGAGSYKKHSKSRRPKASPGRVGGKIGASQVLVFWQGSPKLNA
jgi:hypothetical protein